MWKRGRNDITVVRVVRVVRIEKNLYRRKVLRESEEEKEWMKEIKKQEKHGKVIGLRC